MKRYYICPLTGSGTIADPYRLRLPPRVSHAAVIPTGPDGLPLRNWGLAQVVADPAIHAALAADQDIDALPSGGFDERADGDLTTIQRAALAIRLRDRGLTIAEAEAALRGTVRQLVRTLGQRLEPDFDEAQFGSGG